MYFESYIVVFHLQTSELTPIEGQNVITATLNFAPAETSHESFYVCQILGDVDTNVAVNVFVDQGDYWELFILHTYIIHLSFIHFLSIHTSVHFSIQYILPIAHTFVHPFTHLPIHPFIHTSVHLSIQYPSNRSYICPSIHPPIYPSIHSYIHTSFYPISFHSFIYLSIHSSIHPYILSIYLPTYLPIHPFIHTSICPFIHLFIYHSICMLIYPSICPFIHPTVPSTLTLYVYLLPFTDALEIISEIPDIDITNQTVGDSITIACQVETCVSQATVSIYREEEVIFSTIISNNQQESVTVAFSLTVEEDSAGQYACRAFAPEGSTPLSSFNIIGELQC